MAAIRILVVDEHPAIRAGLTALLDDEPGLTVTATVADAGEALECIADVRPDVAIVDYHLPDVDGLTLCHQLRSRAGAPRVIVYSADADSSLGVLGALAGASAVVRKDAPPEQLLQAVRAAANGEEAPPPSPEALRRVADRLRPEDLPILAMAVHHTPDVEIAETLGVPEVRLARRRWAIVERLRGRALRERITPRAPRTS